MTTPETRELSAAKAFARATVHGLWIAIPTPFSADGRLVDEEVLEAAVERYVETLQVDGIFCGGVMGEFGSLTIDERRHVHEVVVRQVTGRVPVVAHVGHHAFAETVALCGHAADHGIPLGIVMNPFYPRTRPTRSCARGTARWTGRPTCRCSCSTRCTPATPCRPS